MGQAADQLEEKRQEIIEAQVVNVVSEAQAVEIANENIVPAVRKELQKLLVGRLKWMHLTRRDPNVKKIMNTKKDLFENCKLVKTSMGCVGVSKETVVNIEIN